MTTSESRLIINPMYIHEGVYGVLRRSSTTRAVAYIHLPRVTNFPHMVYNNKSDGALSNQYMREGVRNENQEITNTWPGRQDPFQLTIVRLRPIVIHSVLIMDIALGYARFLVANTPHSFQFIGPEGFLRRKFDFFHYYFLLSV